MSTGASVAKPDGGGLFVAVADAGPLIHLDELGQLRFLTGFQSVLVPERVFGEAERHRPGIEARLPGPVQRVHMKGGVPPALKAVGVALKLDRGELHALHLAISQGDPVTLLTDDLAARQAGKMLGLEVHGTIGLVVRSARLGLATLAEVVDILAAIPNRTTLHIKGDLLASVIAEVKSKQEPSSLIAGSIDTGASDAERARQIKDLVARVVGETDRGEGSSARRQWIVILFCYVIWWEGHRATAREQIGGGPGRGLVQFEPLTLWDLLHRYVLGPTPGLIANLATAAGVTEEEMSAAIRAFDRDAAPPSNAWPITTPASAVERWVRDIDTFAVKLMRYEFRRQGAHRFPPSDPADLPRDPRDDAFKRQMAEQWAEWWKRSFPGGTEERERRIREFVERAREFDRLDP